ncbi:hypothetical protein N5079_26550 [Planotetraspora sp. A-T 1434]|uniref:hypothetical protein n=1 Tax=Planotetraspora sp. A-T 1434 TaxID=2979219 RepID=UPI0021BFD780|nr:hypothetical protein [Planotetraspora sp. A-T 1434]MCT9933779.1 hypothetical protein [Planotetraspora sp. A-T 1434]
MDEMEQLARQVYVAARAGDLDTGPILELAFAVHESYWNRPAARELLERPTAELSDAALSRLTWQLLDEAAFEPGFDLEPGWWRTLEEAVAVVERDVRTDGVAKSLRLVVADWDRESGQAQVELDGGAGGPWIRPSSGQDLQIALELIADAVQDIVMEARWAVWPTCAAHNLGLRTGCVDGRAVWTCAGSDRHVVAPVGDLPTA